MVDLGHSFNSPKYELAISDGDLPRAPDVARGDARRFSVAVAGDWRLSADEFWEPWLGSEFLRAVRAAPGREADRVVISTGALRRRRFAMPAGV